MAHLVHSIDDDLFKVPAGYGEHTSGYRRADLIGAEQGSVHMGLYLCALQAPGAVDASIHAFEKGIFVTEGEVELNRDGKVFRLVRYDYALIPTGTPYSFRNRGTAPARWLEKCAPRPKIAGEWEDSFFVPGVAWPDGVPITPSSPLARMVAHFDKKQLSPPMRIDDDQWGWSRKMLMDQMFGSQHFNMFIIEFAEGGQTDLHDHNFEEAFFVLDGELTFEAEGKSYVLKPGTIAWAGVGAPHGFFMNRGTSCCWFEVMSPQPPLQNIVRRVAAWNRIRKAFTG